MMPGRMSGSSTRRRKRDLPGKLARSSARAASRPRVSESATLQAATMRLLSTEVQMAASAKKLAVPVEGEMARREAADAVAIEGVNDEHDDGEIDEGEDEHANTRRGMGRGAIVAAVALIGRTSAFRGVR